MRFFLLCLLFTPAFSLDFTDPARISGWFNSLAVLALSKSGYSLSGKGAEFCKPLFLATPLQEFTFLMKAKGRVMLSLSGGGDTRTVYWQESLDPNSVSVRLNKPVHRLEICLHLLEDASAVSSFLPQFRHGDLSSAVPLVPSGVLGSNPAFTSSIPLGVNFEAEYVFAELNVQERVLLLREARGFGFNSIRLHKLYELFHDPRYRLRQSEFESSLPEFLQELFDLGFTLSLDVLSYPQPALYPEGVKGWIYLDSHLQQQALDWTAFLASVQINNRSLLSHPSLHFITLFNENSLFHEMDAQALARVLRLYSQHRRFFDRCSLNDFKRLLMQRVGRLLEARLRHFGFSGQIFLSNYQAADQDAKVNESFNPKMLDRHLYVDYPLFSNGLVKVRNRSPLLELDDFVEFFQSLPQAPILLSEVNLPWPNRYQHELIPLLLVLAQHRTIAGLWFYDFRLQSQDFHQGGIFGIQKFASIVHALPWLTKGLTGNLKVQRLPEGILLENEELRIEAGIFAQETYSRTCYTDKATNLTQCFSHEQADGDSFDSAGMIQTGFGKVPMRSLDSGQWKSP